MKTSFLTAGLTTLASMPRLTMAYTDYPMLSYHPDTALPCVIWENHARNLICEEVRRTWNITPAEFSSWNPGVGLDCKPWVPGSYCVVPKARLPAEPSTTTSKPVVLPTTTKSTSTLGPSPTSWATRGCYVDDVVEIPTLQKKLSKDGGDPALTIAKCKDSCFKGFFEFAGVKKGNECHCGSYVAGEKTLNSTECGTPCSGNTAEKCGGTDRLNVFMALENKATVTSTTKPSTSAASSTMASASGASSTKASTSGASSTKASAIVSSTSKTSTVPTTKAAK